MLLYGFLKYIINMATGAKSWSFGVFSSQRLDSKY